MTNQVIDYINRWYDKIYDTKSQMITPDYLNSLYMFNYVPIINPDNYIFDVITQISISQCDNIRTYDRRYIDTLNYKYSKEFVTYKQILYNYIIDTNNEYNIYDCNHHNYYIGNYYIGKYSYFNHPVISDDRVDKILDNRLQLLIIVKQPVNIDHMYDSKNIDLQFLPNCIRGIISEYSQDMVYIFIKMIKDSQNIICDSKSEYNIIIQSQDNMHYAFIHDYLYFRYIVTDWIPLTTPKNNDISSLVSLINININDAMYGIIYYYRCESVFSNRLFIHCIDMIEIYNNFITDYDLGLYDELKNIDKNILSFIKNVHLCKYANDKLQSKHISYKQLNEKLIAFTEK